MLSHAYRAALSLFLLQGCAQPYPYTYEASYSPAAYSNDVPAFTPQRRGRRAVVGSPYALEPLHGGWTGSMDCGGEARTVDLFVFDPHPRPRSVAVVGPLTDRGKLIYDIRGSTSGFAGENQINPSRQLTFPTGYRPLGWIGSLQPDGTFAGTALGGGCGAVTLRRMYEPTHPLFNKAERDNMAFRRELLDSNFQEATATIPTDSLWGRTLQVIGACGLVKCPGINLSGIIGGSPGPTGGGGRGGQLAPVETEERYEKLGENDWRMVPTIRPPQIDPPQIVSPQIVPAPISPFYQ